MYRKFVGTMYLLNILFQSFFNLASPILLMLGLSWIFVTKCGAPTWLYAALGVFGALTGVVSMIKFVIEAMSNLERLEKEHSRNDAEKGKKAKTKSDGE